MTSSTKTSTDDHLTLLLAIGADTVGNVRVLSTGAAPPQRGPMFASRMLDAIVDTADAWPDRSADIGFTDRQTELLADMLRSRIATLKMPPDRS